MLVPVPEVSRAVGHGGRRLSVRARRRLARRALQGAGLGALAVMAPVPALALPQGGSVAAGTASISTNASTLSVNQTSSKAIINWQNFSVAAGESVNFRQPGASSVALNRVLGNDSSQIFGHLTANGQIFLINPNGIVFGPGAQVNVGGLVASTLDMTDQNFLSGNYQFSGVSTASVVNYGKIKTFNGGYVAFIGQNVDNEGKIVTPGGTTALGAGGSVVLTLAGNSLASFQVTTSALNAAVKNGGAIVAPNGVVLLTAQAKNALLQTVVNNTGIIQANSATSSGGVVTLLGGSSGTVAVSGTINANSTSGVGGTVVVSGVNTAVSGTARIFATGSSGGGTIAIGGGVHGGGGIPKAVTTSVASGAVVDASATGSGAGGTVGVWSDVTNPDSVTTVSGSILAKGAGTGAGGLVETSGHLLSTNAVTVETAGGSGTPGTWLLDPYNVIIASNGASGTAFNTGTPYTYTPTGASTILNSAIETALDNNNNVEITTGGAPGSSNGNITVNAVIAWTTGAGLTLDAYGNILINAAITASGSAPALHLLYGQATAAGTSASYAINAPVTLPASATFTTQQGSAGAPVNYTVITTQTQLQNINTGLSGDYALGANITAAGNFTPIGSAGAHFTGMFEGLGHTISNLTINESSTNDVGLFGFASNAGIRDVGLLNASVMGQNEVGPLAGYLYGSTITASYATGTVSGANYVGGLVGDTSNTSITASYATDAVSGSSNIGGLVGYFNTGSIGGSYATGAVTGSSNVGGLVGYMTNVAITRSYATGAASGFEYVGGLVGYNTSNGSVANSYATGAVSGSSNVGGLVGINTNHAIITGSYATGAVSGSSSNVGGLAGKNSNSTITGSYATGAVAGSEYVGGLVGASKTAAISASYATGAVSASVNNAGGLVGYNSNGTISGSYATGTVSGTNFVGGLAGSNNDGTITDSYAAGAVSGMYYIGGLVGSNNTSTITASYATGAVAGSNNIGGLVGDNSNSSIADSYADGAVSGLSSTVGGLVGKNTSTITASYAAGAVTSVGFVGGLVGINSNGGTITDAYATGAVTGSSNAGGLVGYNSNGTITKGYYDSATTGQANGVGSSNNSGVTGLTTEQWLTEGPIATGTFNTSTWVSGYPYPVLTALPYIVVTGSASQSPGAALGAVSISSILNQSGVSEAGLVNASGITWLSAGTAGSIGSYVLGGTGLAFPAGYQLTYDGVDRVAVASQTSPASSGSGASSGSVSNAGASSGSNASAGSTGVTVSLAGASASSSFGYLAQLAPINAALGGAFNDGSNAGNGSNAGLDFGSNAWAVAAPGTAPVNAAGRLSLGGRATSFGGCGPNSGRASCAPYRVIDGGVKKPVPDDAVHLSRTPPPPARQEAAATTRRFD